MVKDIEKQLEQKTKQQDKLARQIKDAEDNLADTKDKLVDVGRSIQKNEKDLAWLEYRIDKLETRQQDIEQNLDKDRESLAELVLAIERIRRMPPEAIFVKPGAPLKTAQTAMLLRDVIPAIHDRADALRDKLEEVREITQELKDKRDKVLSTSQKLETEQKDLSKLVKKRQTLYAATRSHFIKEQKSVQKISAQAQNLQELVKELEDNKKRLKAVDASRKAVQQKRREIPLPKAGEPRLPILGSLRVAYNEKDDIGATSKGLHIESTPGALVVAPMAGIVRFAGPFKRYGNLVIIEHEKGYHSLVAGFEKIDTVVGHSLDAGEPVGFLPKSKNKARPTLYFEFRRNGNPINPAKKFAVIG